MSQLGPQSNPELSRGLVSLDVPVVRADLQHRVVLLTGAAGAIGSELARQIAASEPTRLVLLDRAESDLYFTHLELVEAHPGVDLVPVICDITDESRLKQVFAQHRPEYVVHAAGAQLPPLMEPNLLEVIRSTVLGTLQVATNAARYGAAKLILVSANMANRPSCVFGATNRVAERIIFGLPNLHRAGTDFRAVRLDSELSSKARVEAAQMVLEAGSLPATAGAIAVLEAGEPIRILEPPETSAGTELVQKLSRLFAFLAAGDLDGLLTTLGELVPESASSVREYSMPQVARGQGNGAGAWAALADSAGRVWRERRRDPTRRTEPPPLQMIERREGQVCRRKTPRVGGRRRSDVEALLVASGPREKAR